VTETYEIEKDLLQITTFPNGRKAGLMRFMFTWAIVADFNLAGYDERWCYKEFSTAAGALKDWDGEGEPEGWHRHPLSGRRRDEAGMDIGTW